MDWCGLVGMAVLMMAFFSFGVWAENAKAKAMDAEDREFAEAIKHLPPEQQAELWLSKLRHDADADRF